MKLITNKQCEITRAINQRVDITKRNKQCSRKAKYVLVGEVEMFDGWVKPVSKPEEYVCEQHRWDLMHKHIKNYAKIDLSFNK